MQIEQLYAKFLQSSGISTDTRKIERDKIFFALKGENFNANLFAEEALKKGAAWVIADEKYFADHEKIIIVDDALRTLQLLANHHRKQLPATVIAIGGSNGKTTTKELVSAVLETTFKTFSTKGNLNNHIGVPLTLLSVSNDTKIAVIEMGANHLGETTLLCEIADPDLGLITNNGKDHLEGYGGMEGVRKGNGELYDFLRNKNGTAFVCADQLDLLEMSEGINRITYGKNEAATCSGKLDELFPYLKIELRKTGEQLSTNLIGHYNFDNIMAAVCIGKHFGCPMERIQQAIAGYRPSNNRSQILKQGSNTFILDAYNANPSSMQAALENFSLMPVKNKIVILGDMLELGSVSEREHLEMISAIQKQQFEQVILVGTEFEKVLGKSKTNFLHFKNVHELKDWFEQQQFANHFFLLKGSRLIGLEKLVK
jgi:UDP-N-acetylmuramoyl-tripeptide--D-alanyl-D-alanine ligase